MKSTLRCLAALGFLVSFGPTAPAAPIIGDAIGDSGCEASTSMEAPTLMVARGWVAKKTDNLCGLRDPSQLSNPAKLNYKRCLAATPEMKKIKDEGIRPSSPKGIQLKNAAATRISTAANTIRKAGGFCSVWKTIKHNDGRKVDDITARIVAQY